MAVLYVKDQNGKFVPIPSLRGRKGDTPVRGVDYWTEEDVQQIQGYIDDQIADVSDEVDKLNEEIVTDVTIDGYQHTDISAGKKFTICPDERFDQAPVVFLGKNFWPDTPYVSEGYVRHGMSLNNDGYSYTVKGLPTVGSSYDMVPNVWSGNWSDIYWPLPDGLSPGDSIDLHLFADTNVNNRTPSINVRFYDESKNLLDRFVCAISVGDNYKATKNKVIPDSAAYVMFQIPFSKSESNTNEYNRTIHPVIVKSETEIVTVTTSDNGALEFVAESETEYIHTAPYKSSVEQKVAFSEYVEMLNDEDDETSSIVTPEMFGAYADDKHDDTVALQKCIDYAFTNKKSVVGGGRYTTTSPIYITGNFNTVKIKYIRYESFDCAVVVSGAYNSIKFDVLEAPNGAGFRLRSDQKCIFNDMYVGYILCAKNGVEYVATAQSIIGNRLTFNRIDVGDDYNCIYQTGEDALPVGCNHGNNNFIGGNLSGGNWAVYGAKGRDTYTTLHIEGTTNGIFIDSVGLVRIIAPRTAELWSNAFDADYNHIPGKGVFVSMGQTQSAIDRNNQTCSVQLQLFGVERLMPQNFDFTRMLTTYVQKDGREVSSKSRLGGDEIQAKLVTRYNYPVANSFILHGPHILIKNPVYRNTKTLTANDHGYEGDYSVIDSDEEFYIYEKFITAENGCDYKLPPSYDVIAFNCFEVFQAEGTSCILRDWRGTVIFDGATLGAGRYEIKARLADGESADYYDNRNQVWDIYKNSELVDSMPHAAE